MAQTCKTCSRTNPAEARYCYFDGAVLNGQAAAGPVALGTQPFPSAFVFPSGRAYQNFDQLALACWNDRPAALEALKEGDLARFLSGLGRADLAKAARDAAKANNPEQALEAFLDKLPGEALRPPQLVVLPDVLWVGVVPIGQDRKAKLHLSNEGMRLLSGNVTIQDCVWLSLGEGAGASKKLFQFAHELDIPLLVHGKRLSAAPKQQEGHLVIESNGGNVIVTVRIEVPVKPFAAGPAAGATSPRQLAEKALKQPKEMAGFFESGAVAAWYKDNGWPYPVQGPTSSGFGAIQQFFEALGLAKPPKVELSVDKLVLRGKPGETVTQPLEVLTQENRMVYALANTDQPWLKVETLPPKGKTASLRLVACVPDQPGETLSARVAVRANGNQRFLVPVTLSVAGTRRAVPAPPTAARPARPAVLPMPEGFGAAPPVAALAPASAGRPATPVMPAAAATAVSPAPVAFTPDVVPAAAPAPARLPVPVEEAPPASRWWHLLPGALLPLLLFGMFVVHDLHVKAPPSLPPDIDDDAGQLDPTAYLAVNFQKNLEAGDPNDQIYRESGIRTGTMRFGLVMPLVVIEMPDPRTPGKKIRRPKQLTFDSRGRTNNTCLRLDDKEVLFGQEPGRWQTQKADIGEGREGAKSVWFYPEQKVRVTQTVEIVRGASSRKLDTALVRYLIENTDDVSHRVGIRFMLDTLIGNNDGVPFLLPGHKGLCDTMAEFEAEEVPDFIQALENDDLEKPGTVAHVQLRLGGGLEAPARVTLGAWPNEHLAELVPEKRDAFLTFLTKWQVPLLSMKSIQKVRPKLPPDSCVVMYWPEKTLPAKTGRRLVGFTYGLEDVESHESSGKLALTVGGSFQVGGEFAVTAYVKEPAAGQKLTLRLPENLELAGGSATKPVPEVEADAARRISTVTWSVRSKKAGKYTLKVESSTGKAESKTVTVKEKIFLD